MGAVGSWFTRRLDEIPVVPDPEPDTADWIPLRHHFGLGAFGVNVFVARNDGDSLVPDHVEDSPKSAGHEELYVVLSGVARFTVAGESFDADARTVVVVVDPAIRRSARAVHAGTSVLVIGGRKGEAFEVSEWDARWTANLPPAEGSR